MVVDTSVVVAIMLNDPDCDFFIEKLAEARFRLMSAASYMEAGIVLTSRLGKDVEEALDRTLYKADIAVSPVSSSHAKLALAAFRQYGKGRHPAALNFGDCFSYALAKSSAEPLLFKGSDFAKTDILVA